MDGTISLTQYGVGAPDPGPHANPRVESPYKVDGVGTKQEATRTLHRPAASVLRPASHILVE